jgi:hypothetical protein
MHCTLSHHDLADVKLRRQVAVAAVEVVHNWAWLISSMGSYAQGERRVCGAPRTVHAVNMLLKTLHATAVSETLQSGCGIA